MRSQQIHTRIAELKLQYGEELLILGHHYQSDDVIQYADLRGDSFQLAREAAASKARYIVFCGVRFMAESARVLAREDQLVIHPVPEAGLPDGGHGRSPGHRASLVRAGATVLGDMNAVTPVTYVNSDVWAPRPSAARTGGAVCTSSNAERVLDWGIQSRRARPLCARSASWAQHGLQARHQR